VNQGAFHRGESSSFHFWETLKVAFLSRGPADFLDQRLESGLCDESGFDRVEFVLRKDEHFFSSLSVPGLDDQARRLRSRVIGS